MTKIHTIIFLACTALLVGGCGESEQARSARETAEKLEELKNRGEPQDLQDAMAQVGEVLGALGGNVETVSAQDLKVMLPGEEFAGMERKSYSAKKSGAFGVTVSKAEAVYESVEDGSRLTLSISDIGSMQGVAAMGLNWLNIEIDEETESGFERTTDFRGHKSHQKMQTYGGRTVSDFTVFVGSRFVIQANGQNVDWDVLEKVVGQVPLDDLEALQEQAVTSQE